MTRQAVCDVKEYISDYLRQKGIPLNKPFRCLNPGHEDRNPSMQFNQNADNVHCFACGATYDLIDLVGMDYGIDAFSKRFEKACELFGVTPSSAVTAKAPPTQTSTPQEENAGRLASLCLLSRGEIDYFTARGLTPETVEKHRLFQADGYAYFPVTEGGKAVSFCARALDDGQKPRYKNAPGPMGIWNADLLFSSGGGRELFVTEGILDALCLEQMGYAAVALCGCQNAGKFLRRCGAPSCRADSWRLVACGDADPAGRKMNETLLRGLRERGIPCAALELPWPGEDIAGAYLTRPRELAELLRSAGAQDEDSAAADSAAEILHDFFLAAEQRAGRGGVSTGFRGLDAVLDGGLYPGLYVMGAISSLGKTSFLLQMADAIAARGADVLFYSLEQSRFELIARSLSRTTALLSSPGRQDALSARQLLGGGYPDSAARRALLQRAREAYAPGARRLFLREGMADIGPEEIRREVAAHRERRGGAPVVMVDYLQILRPADSRATDKQNIDRAVVELKRLSRDFDTPVLAVSSFNRENYRAAVSMEAFKESGAVEYSSDVLLGMQLEGAGGRDFDINRAKAREPRKVELVLLKNRNGIPYATIPFRYTARFSLFEESEGPKDFHPDY